MLHHYLPPLTILYSCSAALLILQLLNSRVSKYPYYHTGNELHCPDAGIVQHSSSHMQVCVYWYLKAIL
jgi:hypothetical protein